MTDEPQDREDRDRERSDEAHWKVAEEGAEDEIADDGEGSRDSGSERDDFLSNLEKASRPDDSAIR